MPTCSHPGCLRIGYNVDFGFKMRSYRKQQTEKFKLSDQSSFSKSCSRRQTACNAYDKMTLKNILKHLSKEKNKKKRSFIKECCPAEDSSDNRVDQQVKLRCRQLPNVVQELRKALMRQDWDYVSTLVMILCHPGLKYYASIILRVCFILLFNHPKSNFKLLKNFVRLTTDYVLEEDINKFIRILFALRHSPLSPLKSGKYVRKTGDYKVARDPEFENL